MTTARRKAVDRLRSTAASERRQRAWGELAITWDLGDGSSPIPDDRLRLIFTCCHPALSLEAQVALTLRSLGGLSTEAVAKAFLISETAMAQRVVRAKRKIRQAAIAYPVPEPGELPGQLDAVLAVITLIFNAGDLAAVGCRLVRPGSVRRGRPAVRCGRRAAARRVRTLGPGGDDALPGRPPGSSGRPRVVSPLTLEEQDRTRSGAGPPGDGTGPPRPGSTDRAGPGPTDEGSVAGVAAPAPRSDLTDWNSIVRLYDQLLVWEPTPVVRLNRVVAVAMAASQPPAWPCWITRTWPRSWRLPALRGHRGRPVPAVGETSGGG